MTVIQYLMFTTEKELSELTGVSHDELWNNGFDLDDWDIGFRCDKKIKSNNWLLKQMENYCCGYQMTEYKGFYYYMVYHA